MWTLRLFNRCCDICKDFRLEILAMQVLQPARKKRAILTLPRLKWNIIDFSQFLIFHKLKINSCYSHFRTTNSYSIFFFIQRVDQPHCHRMAKNIRTRSSL